MSVEDVGLCLRSPAFNVLQVGLPISFELRSVALCYVSYECTVGLILIESTESLVFL
jgi:hypothetical protein